MLDHWDNLDGTVERGYAGRSLWDWSALPRVSTRAYIDYARANASIGINGVVLNNVNANAQILTPELPRQGGGAGRRLAAVRHQGLSLGALLGPDRDRRAQDRRPTRPRSASLVAGKGRRNLSRRSPISAASWSRPIPKGSRARRTTAEPMPTAPTCSPPRSRRMAATLIWRAFVYSGANADDRARQAYAEFKPLDGKFARQRHRPGQERPDRLPAARALPSLVRGDAAHARRDGSADHQANISARARTARLSRADVGGGAAQPTPSRPRCAIAR